MSRAANLSSSPSDAVAVLGGGIIGLSIAYELAVRRGRRVTVFDTRPPGRGASWAAAGMIAPAFEAAAEPGVHPRLFDLCMESAALWPGFAAELEARAGRPVGFDPQASLAAALDEAQLARLVAISRVLAARGVLHTLLEPGELVRREPALARGLAGGMELPTDLRVHNRAVVSALIDVLGAHPRVRFVEGAAPLVSEGGRVRLAGHGAIVAAAGWSTASIKVEERGQMYSLVNWDVGLDDIDCHAGQMLAVRAGPGAPARVVRAGHVYLVPRGDEVVIGATVEPGRILDAPEPEAIEALRQEGIRLCPGLAGAPVVESWAGIRPGTPDHAPFLGETVTPGLFVAGGHYRNGILLAPVTARILADAIEGKDIGELAASFSTSRDYTATD
ncbi:MAG: FAD-dependent oxidoreductase [Acidobacteria bacterium]|nr:FAD-dependent oxidoreductase [Acidobacteriota bacterium]